MNLQCSFYFLISYKNPKLWTVSFGRTLSSPLTTRKVESIIVHENYASHKHDDDIAVVKLSSPVLFSENLHRVCLPDATFQVLPKSKVFVTGWGALKANGEFLKENKDANSVNPCCSCMQMSNTKLESIDQDNPMSVTAKFKKEPIKSSAVSNIQTLTFDIVII